MLKKSIFAVSLFLFASACRSQPSGPESACRDLAVKAADKSFPLRGLYGMRGLGRCPGFSYDLTQLSELEKKLYSTEIASLTPATPVDEKPEPTEKELTAALKTEKDPAVKFKLYRQLRNLQRFSDRRPDFLKTSAELYKWAADNYRKHKKEDAAFAMAYEAAQLQVKAQWTANDAPAAEKSADQALQLLKNKKNSLAELYFLKGRISEENKKPAEALKQYTLALDDLKKYDPKNLSFSSERVLWLKAWIPYKEKDFQKAVPAFAALAENTADLSDKSRAQFFQARSLKALGQNEAAQQLLESITKNDFFGYYSLVSYRELGKKLPALKNMTATGSLALDSRLGFLDSSSLALYRALIKYNELPLAEKAIPLLAKNKDEELSLSVNFAQENRIYGPVFRAFSRLDNAGKVELFLRYPELIFPRPYDFEVRPMAERTGLPASLIYSIMKQESAFNEKARSRADALGLMQVIPRLAKQLAKKFEVPYSVSTDLYDPATNIKLGSFELMEQVKKQNGQLTFVAAAYNAGPNALAGWLKNRRRDDILEFIEDIPYDETRTYVKLIARNKLFYERVSNRDSEQEFPAEFLN